MAKVKAHGGIVFLAAMDYLSCGVVEVRGVQDELGTVLRTLSKDSLLRLRHISLLSMPNAVGSATRPSAYPTSRSTRASTPNLLAHRLHQKENRLGFSAAQQAFQ